MQFKPSELEFLSAWAREEKAPNPYILPAHEKQAAHRIQGVTLIRAIKAWARAESRKDEDIFDLFDNPNPPWPWSSVEDLNKRLAAVAEEVAGHR
jgi:hypothetical protein